MKKIAIVTVGRSDYGILRPLVKRLHRSGLCQVQLIVGGTHFDARHGFTRSEILADEIPISAEVVVPVLSDDATGVADSYSKHLVGMLSAYARLLPDLIVVLGDRFEMFAAAAAAVFNRTPLAHIHGGELTLGAMDDVMRHAMTKMSHLHFASTPQHADRILQMGEEPWRVHVSGALALDNLHELKLLSSNELQKRLGIEFEDKPVIMTFHPPTLENLDLELVADSLTTALANTGRTIIITAPNADPGGEFLHQKFNEAAKQNPKIHFLESLGTEAYFSLMGCSAAMVGNSSSGIIEAASFHLPVVNIGRRQEGRTRARNVIECGSSRMDIEAAITLALSGEFKSSLEGITNPYGCGRAAELIANVLLTVPFDEHLLCKRFQDLPPHESYILGRTQ